MKIELDFKQTLFLLKCLDILSGSSVLFEQSFLIEMRKYLLQSLLDSVDE